MLPIGSKVKINLQEIKLNNYYGLLFNEREFIETNSDMEYSIIEIDLDPTYQNVINLNGNKVKFSDKELLLV